MPKGSCLVRTKVPVCRSNPEKTVGNLHCGVVMHAAKKDLIGLTELWQGENMSSTAASTTAVRPNLHAIASLQQQHVGGASLQLVGVKSCS